MVTNETSSTRRLPAEWESASAILLAWPHEHTDWSYMLPEVTRTFIDIADKITQEMVAVIVAPDINIPRHHLADLPERQRRRLVFCQVDTNDTWARDFGPITCVDTADASLISLDFKFNGWGLKFAADRDNLITSKLFNAGLFPGRMENQLGFVLEGGSIESDGRGTILTTSECLLSPNRNGNLSREEIERHLCKSLGANRVLWLDYGYLAGDDTDSHIDTLARLCPEDLILYVKCNDESDEHFQALDAMERQLKSFLTLSGQPYNLMSLPLPDPIYDADGERLPATYANFLITPGSILLPVYGQPANDRLAQMTLQAAFPDRDIKTVDCRSLIRQHGSLHCVTMQLPQLKIL